MNKSLSPCTHTGTAPTHMTQASAIGIIIVIIIAEQCAVACRPKHKQSPNVFADSDRFPSNRRSSHGLGADATAEGGLCTSSVVECTPGKLPLQRDPKILRVEKSLRTHTQSHLLSYAITHSRESLCRWSCPISSTDYGESYRIPTG